MRNEIRLSKSVINNEEIEAVSDVLKREYLGMGSDVQKFEENLAKFFGRETLCCNTGTAAIHLALQALNLKKGDEVLVQSLTYLATFQAIAATGATPIPCEINEDDFSIDLEDAKNKISSSTKVILPVLYAGCGGNLNEVYQFAEKYMLRVVEDAAHAFGSMYKGKIVGSFGDISCFSFDGIKNITSGEGGAIVTSDQKVLEKVSDARLLGVEKDAEKRYAGKRSWEFDVSSQGWRYHMSNIMAAIGNEQLKKFNSFKEKRQNLAKLYVDELSLSKKIKLLRHNYSEVVPHIFVIRLLGNNRDIVRHELNKLGIQTGLHYKPNHLLTYFCRDRCYKLPKTEHYFSQLITLPLHPDLTENDVKFVCKSLLKIIENNNYYE